MTEAEAYEQLTEIFRDVFMRDDMVLTPELTAKDVPGWDSFKQIEIILTLEERLNIKIGVQDLERLKCVGDLATVLREKQAT